MTIEMCPTPKDLPPNPTEFQKLKALGERQKYMLCRIQSAQRVMEALAIEISKDSIEAGVLTRGCVKEFRAIEMQYLEDSRRVLRIQGERVSYQDIMNEGN